MHDRTAERFLSQASCASVAKRIAGLARGGGHTTTQIESTWTGNVRWARNRITTSGDVRTDDVGIERNVRGAVGTATTNQLVDAKLDALVRRAERMMLMREETQESVAEVEITEAHARPVIWSDATYTLTAAARAQVVRSLVHEVERRGMLAAGYIQVSAHGRAVMGSRGRAMYYPFTEVEYSVTVRDPKGTGSGWAGLSHYDWTKIDAESITRRALEKCLASRNPVALEPGRYTTILEPQAVCGLVDTLFGSGGLSRIAAEAMNPPPPTPFWKSFGQSRLGDPVVDERISVSTDPMDPELGFPPFSYLLGGEDYEMQYGGGGLSVYHPAVWIKQGVLTNLAYSRAYAVDKLGKDTGLPTLGAFRISVHGPTVSTDEMIATTTRGLLVTRFTDVGGQEGISDGASWIRTGYTRDGLWLIENGKISKPVKNFRFLDSGYFMLQSTRLEQCGIPVRVYHPDAPVVVPPLKIKDFNFIQLADAI